MTWLESMHREAVALALAGWTWHEGDQAEIVCGMDLHTTIEPPMFALEVHVERPGADLRMERHFVGESAAEFFNDLMERGANRWTSVFCRFQVEYEETHASIEDAMRFLHDGWYAADRSPVAIKGPDGELVMDADAIAADRRHRSQSPSR